MKQLPKIAIIGVVMLVGALLTSWFVFQPYHIRKDCSTRIANKLQNTSVSIERYNLEYQFCLHRHGM